MDFAMIEEELKKLEKEKNKVKVFGIGEFGCRTINGLKEHETQFIAIDSDESILNQVNVDLRLQVNIEDNPELKQKQYQKIQNLIKNSFISKEQFGLYMNSEKANNPYLIVIIADIKNQLSMEIALLIAKIAKFEKIITIAIVNNQFFYEEHEKLGSVKNAISELRKQVDNVLYVSTRQNNLKLAILGISELVTGPGCVNNSMPHDLDFLEYDFHNSGDAVIGIGVAKGENKYINAAKFALNNLSVRNIKITEAKKCYVIVSNIVEEELNQLQDMLDVITISFSDDANIFVMDGNRYFKKPVDNKIHVTIVATCFNSLF